MNIIITFVLVFINTSLNIMNDYMKSFDEHKKEKPL